MRLPTFSLPGGRPAASNGVAGRGRSAHLAALAAAVLTACGSLPDRGAAERATAALPTAWNAPLPHGGSSAELVRWWADFDDPLVARLVTAADAASPTVASARARIEEARAARIAAGALLLPAVDAQASFSRGRPDLSVPTGNSAGVSLGAGWELDVFGGNRARRAAAGERLGAAEASWHDARVAVAAETATTYAQLRNCEGRLAQARLDARSRGETARLTDLSTGAGFESRANAALARASAAQARTLVAQQAQACSELLKALTALTAIAEPALRAELASATARMPLPRAIAVTAVPASALAQRPDVFAAGREVEAASADVRQADAARLPRVSLAGSIGRSRFETSAGTLSGNVWSVGPVAVSVPVFDAGARRADAAAARARYEAAVAAYAGTLREAVREVENALVALQTAIDRQADAEIAAVDFEAAVRAVDARYRSGLGSLFELEDARRNALTAQNLLLDLSRDRTAAWIALYRALGGGWQAPADTPPLLTGAPVTRTP
ncbi:MAG TPA: efflux transporter outer membrane subunit [Caldimonas sp.]|nr:efflux transporter outer membrane subunit [Caldimonas sp.]HEX2540736.1 efflux transporter outer membrane subunit [Caldimonas sp.]